MSGLSPLSFTGQHVPRQLAVLQKQAYSFLSLTCACERVDHQAIVIKKFLAGLDVTQGFKEDAVAILLGFQIGFAGVINPLSGVAIVLGVDDVAVV